MVQRRSRVVCLAAVGGWSSLGLPVDRPTLQAQEFPPPTTASGASAPATLLLPAPPPGLPESAPLPINLPTALQLAGVRPIDIAVATQRTQIAAAELDRANLFWLPNLYLGADYQRHDGQ